jgi:dTDP-4-dehydrorhamnose 3,5-epimerase
MQAVESPLRGLYVITPKVFEDARGYFYESFRSDFFHGLGITRPFVQDNQSKSSFGVLRGLHYQVGEHAQAKLVRVVSGTVFDVGVDLREDSPTYGQYFGEILSAENKKQMYIPRGFAHGFVVLSETAEFFYKCDNLYNKEAEGGIIWNDPTLQINWNIDISKLNISEKDSILPHFGHHRR